MSQTSNLLFPERRRLYLMRHGEVTYVVAGRPVPPDGVELNDEGRRQAEAARLLLADVPFDRVVVSGLPRTVETARTVLGERGLPLETVPELSEIRGGRNEDIAASEDPRGVFVGALTGTLTRERRFLMGESFGEFQDRVLPAWRALLADRSWKHLLLVAHGGTNRVLLSEMLGVGLAGAGHFEQDPACVNIIDFDEHDFAIARMINYTPYNPHKFGDTLTTMERYFLQATQGGN